ncbi:NADP-dependent 3-hydroxy acid dehydrogenase [Scenedesmus sp. PABB004]|nr:NADP-dependent 3-hydroxy acid dehydrogenase [Scenedesmus sp. PABB004]
MALQSALYAPYDISGQTALVTGASSGFGEALAWRLAEAGAKVIIAARRRDRLDALAAALRGAYPGAAVHVVQLDMRDLPAVAALPGELPVEFQQVDILVNNAGLALGVSDVHSHDIEDAVTMMETNYLSVVCLTRALVGGMVSRGRGHVVNISSIAGREAYAGGALYCASKHALDAFTTATRHDLVGTPVRVTSVAPGAAKTEFSVVRFKGDVAAADAVYAGFDPLTAPDIADNVMYALTRPPHVQVADMLVYANNQSSAKGIARLGVLGCVAARPPAAVQQLSLVPNNAGTSIRVNWREPSGSCVSYFTVSVTEVAAGRSFGGLPSQTRAYSLVVNGLRPGIEYMVSVTAVNERGAGPSERQTIKPMAVNKCSRVPPAVKNLVAQPVDGKTLEVSWAPGERECYEAAQVLAYEARTNTLVHRASVADVYDRIPGLKPRTAYRIEVTPQVGNRVGPASSVSASTVCSGEAPGSATGMAVQATSPPGTLVLTATGVSNDACVDLWEVQVRGNGRGPTFKVEPSDAATGAVRFVFSGAANQQYTFAATAIGYGGARGITSNIGPWPPSHRQLFAADVGANVSWLEPLWGWGGGGGKDGASKPARPRPRRSASEPAHSPDSATDAALSGAPAAPTPTLAERAAALERRNRALEKRVRALAEENDALRHDMAACGPPRAIDAADARAAPGRAGGCGGEAPREQRAAPCLVLDIVASSQKQLQRAGPPPPRAGAAERPDAAARASPERGASCEAAPGAAAAARSAAAAEAAAAAATIASLQREVCQLGRVRRLLESDAAELTAALRESERARREAAARYAFVVLDSDGDGYVSAGQAAGYELFAHYAPCVLAAAFGRWRWASGFPGYLTMEDFLRFVEFAEDRSTRAAQRFWFSVLDADGDGRLGWNDCREAYDAVDARGAAFVVPFADLMAQLADMVPRRPGAPPAAGFTAAELWASKLGAGVLGLLTNHRNMLLQRSTAEWSRGAEFPL